MGCDIHVYVEKKNEFGIWEAIDGVNPLIADYRSYAATSRERGDFERAKKYEEKANMIEDGSYAAQTEDKWDVAYYSPKVFKNWIFDGRNYNLFGILAGVRRYDLDPIAEPRDIPQDASPMVVADYEGWEENAHSATYLTLRDLKEYDWKQVIGNSGYVTMKVYEQFKETGNPYPCCAGVAGVNVEIISIEEMEQKIAGINFDPSKSYYTEIAWGDTAANLAGDFCTYSIPELEKLSEQVDGEDVRIVLWFDN